MKKIFAIILLISAMFAISPVNTEANFNLNNNFNSNFTNLSNIFHGNVVVNTFLSIREQPNVNSREIMRVYNGDRLELREDMPGQWVQVLSVNGNKYGVPAGEAIGWVNIKYIKFN